MLLRLDIAERVAAELAWATRRGPTAMPAGLASRFSLKADLLPVVLRRLGFRVVPAERPGGGRSTVRRRRPCCCRCGAGARSQAAAPPVHAHGPFAALAALKR